MIRIRKALSGDMKNILMFLQDNDSEDKDIDSDDCFVYYDNDMLLGCGISFAKGDYCFIKNIIVAERFRRGKVGTAIAKTILNSYECNGAKFALCRGRCNGFCESLGFRSTAADELPVSVRDMLYDQGNIKPLYFVSLAGYFKGCG